MVTRCGDSASYGLGSEKRYISCDERTLTIPSASSSSNRQCSCTSTAVTLTVGLPLWAHACLMAMKLSSSVVTVLGDFPIWIGENFNPELRRVFCKRLQDFGFRHDKFPNKKSKLTEQWFKISAFDEIILGETFDSELIEKNFFCPAFYWLNFPFDKFDL